MKRSSILAASAVLVVLVSTLALQLGTDAPRPEDDSRVTLDDVLGDAAPGFERATSKPRFVFPDDHGPHPRFRSEWWYYTGNLETVDGRHFGFQLTFFRFALSPREPERSSAWATHQVYMAHFAVSDVAAGRFRSFERLSRGALDLAGAQGEPFKVWLDDWAAQSPQAGLFPMRLRAAQDGFALDLSLRRGKPLVLQGDGGLSRKSGQPGNASYYYSFTRMPARGTLHLAGEKYAVSGSAWMDREWGTSALDPGQAGWDWFALQLSDQRELMYYRLRRRDGSADPFSAGTLVDASGVVKTLAAADVDLRELDHWTSPRTQARYPVRWQLRVPSEALDLEVAAYLPEQEVDHSVRYWEGAASVRGLASGHPVSGEAYVEMTGYAD